MNDVLETNLQINLIRYVIFVKVFDCDIEEWKRYLRESTSGLYSVDETSFVSLLERRLKDKKGLLKYIKFLVKETES